MNIHTPQRLEGESFADYKERRKRSQWRVKVARLQGSAALNRACRDQHGLRLRELFSRARGGL